jgi:hypothetical protein
MQPVGYTNLQNHRLVIARRRSRRSNPEATARTLDCFTPLAMTVNDFAVLLARPGLLRRRHFVALGATVPSARNDDLAVRFGQIDRAVPRAAPLAHVRSANGASQL